MKAGLIASWNKLELKYNPKFIANFSSAALGGNCVVTHGLNIGKFNITGEYNFSLDLVPDGSPPSGAVEYTWNYTIDFLGYGITYTETFSSGTLTGTNTGSYSLDADYILEFTDAKFYLNDANQSLFTWSSCVLKKNGTVVSTSTTSQDTGGVMPYDTAFNGVCLIQATCIYNDNGTATGYFAGDFQNATFSGNAEFGWRYKLTSGGSWNTRPIKFYQPLFMRGTSDYSPFDYSFDTWNQNVVVYYNSTKEWYTNGTISLACVPPESNPWTIWALTQTIDKIEEMNLDTFPSRESAEVMPTNVTDQTALVKQGDYLRYTGNNTRYTSRIERETNMLCIPVNTLTPGYLKVVPNWYFDNGMTNKECYSFIMFKQSSLTYTGDAFVVPPGTIIIGTTYSNPACWEGDVFDAFPVWFEVEFPTSEDVCIPDNDGYSALPYILPLAPDLEGGGGGLGGGGLFIGGGIGGDGALNTPKVYYNMWGNPIWNVVLVGEAYNYTLSDFHNRRYQYQYHTDLTSGSNTKLLNYAIFDLLGANGLKDTWFINYDDYCSPYGARQVNYRYVQALAYPTTFPVASTWSSRFEFKKNDGSSATGSVGTTVTNTNGAVIRFELASFTVAPFMVTAISKSVTISTSSSNVTKLELFLEDYEGNSVKIGEGNGTHVIPRDATSKWATSAYLDQLGTYDVATGVTGSNGSSGVFSQSKRASQYGLLTTNTGQYLKIVATLTTESSGYTLDVLTFNQHNLQEARIVPEHSHLTNILFKNGCLLRFGCLTYNGTDTPSVKTVYNTPPTIGDLLSFESNFFLGKAATDSLLTRIRDFYDSVEVPSIADAFTGNSIAGFTELLSGGRSAFMINSFNACYPYAHFHTDILTYSNIERNKYVIIPGNTSPTLHNGAGANLLTTVVNSFGWNVSKYRIPVENTEGYDLTFTFDGVDYFDIKPFKGFSFTEFKLVARDYVLNHKASDHSLFRSDDHDITIQKQKWDIYFNLELPFIPQSCTSSTKNFIVVSGVDDDDNLVIRFGQQYTLSNTMDLTTGNNTKMSDVKILTNNLLVCGYYEVGASTLKLKVGSFTDTTVIIHSSHTTNITDIKDGSALRLQEMIINGEMYLSVAYIDTSNNSVFKTAPMWDFASFS